MRTLILGYGNPDRQDDGVAWHILHRVMETYHLEFSDDLDIDIRDEKRGNDYLFQLQLTPEIADLIKDYDRVCFIDAHTGAVPEDVHFEVVHSHFQRSPFTHHLTPASLLSITETLAHKTPETVLVSVRGYKFGFMQTLSPETTLLTRQAADIIVSWLQQ